jgi:hypothetical protein
MFQSLTGVTSQKSLSHQVVVCCQGVDRQSTTVFGTISGPGLKKYMRLKTKGTYVELRKWA